MLRKLLISALIGQATLAMAMALALSAPPAFAHGGASVAVLPTAAAAGDQVQIKVLGYEDNTLVTVTLDGIGGSATLGTITTDANGEATMSVMIPDTAKSGSYTVKAVGGDDDASADFSVKAAAVTNASTTTGASTMADGSASAAAASGLSYKQPTAQWIGIALGALIASLVGFALVIRRERHA